MHTLPPYSMPDRSMHVENDFGRLFVQHQPQIYGYIRTLVFRSADAEDVLQDTASVLWQKFDEFRPGSSFLAWGLEVARYQVMQFQQQKRRESRHFSESFARRLADATLVQSKRLAAPRETLDECLGKLPAPDRNLFECRYHADVTAMDLARQLAKPPTTVYNALARIRRSLVECLTRAFAKEELT